MLTPEHFLLLSLNKRFTIMKKILITLALILVGIGSWAQSKIADEAAIKKVVETETLAAYNRDYEQWINCFANTPDVAFGFTTLLPVYMVRSYDKLAEFGQSFFLKTLSPQEGCRNLGISQSGSMGLRLLLPACK
jgi:hypothetical protein